MMLGELFDPTAEFSIEETCRPHWSQAGAIVFVTFRTADSIPKNVVERWNREKQNWMTKKGFVGESWQQLLTKLSKEDEIKFHQHFNRCRENCLDTCQGECHLQNPEFAEIVADSLMHFDGERYRMGDFVIMPNHVHLLCAFSNEANMRDQFDSWQKFTATKINRVLGRRGKFWQGDPFDHLVRNPRQYDYLRSYIEDNPKKACLKDGEFYYRKYFD